MARSLFSSTLYTQPWHAYTQGVVTRQKAKLNVALVFTSLTRGIHKGKSLFLCTTSILERKLCEQKMLITVEFFSPIVFHLAHKKERKITFNGEIKSMFCSFTTKTDLI